eukprot:6173117-Pleurochrysis_carterae.AAC.2
MVFSPCAPEHKVQTCSALFFISGRVLLFSLCSGAQFGDAAAGRVARASSAQPPRARRALAGARRSPSLAATPNCWKQAFFIH